MKRHIPIAAMSAALLVGSLSGAPTQASDSYKAYVESMITGDVIVQSNGSTYHQLAPHSSVVANVHVTLDTGASGKIVWFTVWLGLGKEDIGWQYWPEYREDGYHQSFDPRPKSWSGTVRVGIPGPSLEQFALGQCNYQAQTLREQGLSNTAIFAEDRPIELAVIPHLDHEMTGLSGNPLHEGVPWESYQKIKLVCQKWPGMVGPQVADQLDAVPPVVEQASLAVIEQQGPTQGRCKIILSGVIETSEPDVEVSFRYKDDAGNQSKVHDVVTDHAGVAMFSHDYDVPINEQGPETGQVRIAGVNYPFESAWSDYEMDCSGPSFQALVPPKVEIDIVPVDKIKVGRQVCYSKLKLYAKVTAQNAAMSGQGVFIGDYYLSQPQAYELEPGETVLLGGERELDWTPDAQSTEGAAPTDPEQVKKQTIQIGFNLTNANNTVVASVPKKPYTIRCREVRLNPMAVDLLGDHDDRTAKPRPQPAPTGAPRLRLAPQAGDAGPRQPAPTPVLRPRLQQQSPDAGKPAKPAIRMQRLRLKQ